MNFKTHNQKEVQTSGTHLLGEIDTPYSKLVELFGEPTSADEYKSDAEWEIEFEDGLVATIYNWKDGINYLGKKGTETSEITDWHIGGTEQIVVDRINEIVRG